MPEYNEDIAIKLISELRNNLERLESLSQLKIGDFLSDPDKIGSAKYSFIVAIESCIDLCNHIISRNGFRVPKDYADTFEVMSEAGMFVPGFATDLKKMARFRNRLVHLYWEVSNHQIHEILQTRLNDFNKFQKAVARFLDF